MPKRNGQGIELLADPTRRAIVVELALCSGKMSVGLSPSKLARKIERSRPATSRQLGLLHRAGLISARKGFVDRRTVIYFIAPQQLGRITAWLAGAEVVRAFPPSPRDELSNAAEDVA
jgi:DNA-binding transcriptional ArsR family regulator